MHWFVLIMLGNVLWSVSDVIVSMITNRMERSTVLIAWLFSLLQFFVMGVLYVIFPIEHSWIGIFAISGFFSYLGSLCFFKLLQNVDASVSSVAWVFLSLGVALGSVILFGDVWTLTQAAGAILSVSGALGLALWHKRISRLATCGLIVFSGLLFVPSFLIQKSAYLNGLSVITVLFWSLLFYDIYALSLPLLLPSYRRRIGPFLRSINSVFISMIAGWVGISMVSYAVVTSAYKAGDASLVGIAENGQPFFLMIFAWIATKLAPKYAPREILTAQTIGVKIVCFVVVFTGLSLLVIS